MQPRHLGNVHATAPNMYTLAYRKSHGDTFQTNQGALSDTIAQKTCLRELALTRRHYTIIGIIIRTNARKTAC